MHPTTLRTVDRIIYKYIIINIEPITRYSLESIVVCIGVLTCYPYPVISYYNIFRNTASIFINVDTIPVSGAIPGETIYYPIILNDDTIYILDNLHSKVRAVIVYIARIYYYSFNPLEITLKENIV